MRYQPKLKLNHQIVKLWSCPRYFLRRKNNVLSTKLQKNCMNDEWQKAVSWQLYYAANFCISALFLRVARTRRWTISELLMMVLPYNATNAEDCLFFCRHHHQAKLLNLPPELAIASAVFLRSTTLNQDQNSAWKTLHLAPSRRRVNTSKFIELHRLSKKVAKYH